MLSKLYDIANTLNGINDPQAALDYFYVQYNQLTPGEIVQLYELCAGKLLQCARDVKQDPDTMGGELAAMDDALNGRR